MFLWNVNNLLKLKLLSPCSPLAAAGGGEFWGNKVNYGKCANGEQELILARPSICAFQVSFFLRCIGIICLTLYIYLFQYFENLDLVENIVFQILKNIRYPF